MFSKQNIADDKVFYGFQRGNSPPSHIPFKFYMSLWSFFVICLNSQTNDKNKQCIPVGCVLSAAVAVPGGVCTRGCLSRGVSAVQGGVSLLGGVYLPGGLPAGGVFCLGGVHLPEGVCLPFLTHACENITFPQLGLRTVKITNLSHDISRSAVSLKPSTKKTPFVFYRKDTAQHKRSHWFDKRK